MISEFGKLLRTIREKEKDSLRQLAIKLDVSPSFLSAMEVGRKLIPIEYVDKIAKIYMLNAEEINALEESIYITNNKLPIELELMNQAQKDVSIMFARKIKTANDELLKKLREILIDD